MRLILCVLFFSPLFGETILDRLSSLRKGDLVVYSLPRSICIVSVENIETHVAPYPAPGDEREGQDANIATRERANSLAEEQHEVDGSLQPSHERNRGQRGFDSNTIFFRVVTATKDILDREGYPTWITWFDAHAPDASTDETISVCGGTIVHSDSSHDWFHTLLSLDLSPIPNYLRKRAGPKPMAGEHDLRPIWHPKIVVNGAYLETPSVALETKWPQDATPLSNRPLTLYFPTSEKSVRALPYWIESPTSSYRAEVIDSRSFSTHIQEPPSP